MELATSWDIWLHFTAFIMINDELLLPFLRYEQNNQTNCSKNISAIFFLNLLKRKIFSLVASGNYFLHFFNDNKLPVIKCSNSKVDFHWHLYFHLSIYLFLENYTSLLLREQQNLTLSSFEQQIALFGLIRQKLCDAKKSVDRQKQTERTALVLFVQYLYRNSKKNYSVSSK